jgi:histidinol phosphatase-like enzyme
LLLATSWQPLCDRAAMEAAYGAIASELRRPLEIETCTHPGGPPICWCRKPLPGLALSLMARHRIDPARSRWVGTSVADRSLATRLGFTYVEADTFFDTG